MFLSCEIVFATTTESQCYGSHLIRCLTDWPPGCPIVSASERDCPGLFADMTMRYIHSDARKARGRVRRRAGSFRQAIYCQ
jgi:hypothetical protein